MNLYYERTAAGRRLREKRKSMHFTVLQVADRIGRVPNYYRDIECGNCGMSVETLIQLSECLELSIDYILFGCRRQERDLTPSETAYRALSRYSEDVQKNALRLLNVYLQIENNKIIP